LNDVRESGRLRADAMTICDQWVAAGCDYSDPRIAEMKRSLLRSYRSLKAALA